MITAAPTIHDGAVYDVELEEVIPDGEGRSAVLKVLWADEVQVSFHDTRYLLARGLYNYEAHIAAMAYRVEAIQSPSFEVTDPETIQRLLSAHGGSPDVTDPDNQEPLVVQTAGMSVYFPDTDGSSDEASIQGSVREAEWRRIDGTFFPRLVVRIADVGDEGFDLVVYAISNAVVGDTPKVGDDGSASVWLHGHLVME